MRPLASLIYTLEWRHCLALILVESLVDDVAVLDHDVRLRRIGLERQSVLHPFLIVTLTEAHQLSCS